MLNITRSKTNTKYFTDIEGFKKRGWCKYCGKAMEVLNLNQLVCEECGYRNRRMKDGK